LEYFSLIYKRLNITVEAYGESYYNQFIPKIIEILKEKNLTKMDEGALCLYVPKHKVPLMLLKSDGGYNYDTTDMAAAWLRMVDWKCDRAVYITDVGQFDHFDKIFKGAELAGWYDPSK
jgi:arginyl-tRNA synthetase